MYAQANGKYSEALDNYHEALKLKAYCNNRGYIFYKINIIYARNREQAKVLEYYKKSVVLTLCVSSDLDIIAII